MQTFSESHQTCQVISQLISHSLHSCSIHILCHANPVPFALSFQGRPPEQTAPFAAPDHRKPPAEWIADFSDPPVCSGVFPRVSPHMGPLEAEGGNEAVLALVSSEAELTTGVCR